MNQLPPEVETEVPEEGARVALRLSLKQQIAPLLAQAIDALEVVMSDASLGGAVRANARLTGLRIAESAVMLDRLADSLVDGAASEERWDLTAVRVNKKNGVVNGTARDEQGHVWSTTAAALVQAWESAADRPILTTVDTADLTGRIAIALRAADRLAG